MPADLNRRFPCKYVQLKARLSDGRTLTWSHWSPNKVMDELFGIAAEEPYLSAEDYARGLAKSYTEDGIYHRANGDEEYITADKIKELSTTIESKNLTLRDILLHEAHLSDPREARVRPQPDRRITLQRAIDKMEDVMHGRATLNEFFAKVG